MNLKIEQIKQLAAKKSYKEAAAIAQGKRLECTCNSN